MGRLPDRKQLASIVSEVTRVMCDTVFVAGDPLERGESLCRRLVMISSGQVYLVTASPRPPFREADSEAPLMPEPPAANRDHAEWVYGMGKRAAEAALGAAAASRGWSTLALRLPVVQGEADGSGSRRLWGWL